MPNTPQTADELAIRTPEQWFIFRHNVKPNKSSKGDMSELAFIEAIQKEHMLSTELRELVADKERFEEVERRLIINGELRIRYCNAQKPKPVWALFDGITEHEFETLSQAIDQAMKGK